MTEHPNVARIVQGYERFAARDIDGVLRLLSDDVTVLSFACPAGAEAELYRVEGGGHSWPGSELLANAENIVGHTTMSISANEVMWEFFEQHPLVAGGGKS